MKEKRKKDKYWQGKESKTRALKGIPTWGTICTKGNFIPHHHSLKYFLLSKLKLLIIMEEMERMRIIKRRERRKRIKKKIRSRRASRAGR